MSPTAAGSWRALSLCVNLLLSPKTAVLRDIMETNVKFVGTHTDQEEAARLLSKYDFWLFPWWMPRNVSWALSP